MDNNYEQSFKQNVKTNVQASTPKANSVNTLERNNAFFIIAVIMGIITIIETIILVVFMVNYFSTDNYAGVPDDYDEIDTETTEFPYEERGFIYDEDFNVLAVKATCIAQDGTKYTLDASKNYQKQDAASNTVGTGTYSVINGNIISLDGASTGDKVLYYDGETLAEGTNLFTCIKEDEDTEE
jgi:hypothetical protein